jgi:hypothetical protein
MTARGTIPFGTNSGEEMGRQGESPVSLHLERSGVRTRLIGRVEVL